MSLVKKILIVLGSIILLLVVLNWGISAYISKQLPSILHAQKEFPYNVTYDDLDINLVTGSFTMHNAYMAPKDSTGTKFKRGIYGKVKAVKVKHFNLWALLANDRIKVQRVILDTPEVIFYNREKQYNVQDELVKPFKQTIKTGSLGIINGNFKMLDENQNISLKASKVNFEIEDIKVDSAIVQENIPVQYSDYKFSCDSVFYKADKFYNITISQIKNSDSSLTIENFKLIPQYSRADFTKTIAMEKDLFNIAVRKITVPAADWGYLNDILYIHAPQATIYDADINVYRNKTPKDDPSTKKMYSELLRNLKFDLKAEKVMLKDSKIVYEEQINFSKPPAQVRFTNFYATIHNLYSTVNKDKIPNTVIDAQCRFMGSALFKATWSFNITNKNDAFSFKGTLSDIKAQQINPIIKPLMNVSTTGTIDGVSFNYKGNKHAATGTFAMNYDDLKVKIYEEDGKDKKTVTTALGNLVVKDDSDNKNKQKTIDIKRAKDKSFFNFMWLCTQDGIRKIILPKIVEKALPDVKPKREEKKKKKDKD